MKAKPFSWLGKMFSWLWNALDFSRRALLNLIMLVIITIVILNLFSSKPKLEDKTALILDLKGALVEQHSGSTTDTVLAEARGEERRSIQLRDVLQALEYARSDRHINSVVLLLDELDSAGLPVLHEVALALDQFKRSGKKVIAWGSSYSQKQYYLAAHADEIYLHPMGNVVLTGFGGYRTYYKDAFDKLGVTVTVIKAGAYKSFAEQYVANAPSNEAAAAEKYLYEGLWKGFTEDIEKARKFEPGTINQHIEDLPKLAKSVAGDGAKLSQKLKYVDGLKTRDELRELMLQRGARDPQIKSFRQIALNDYLNLVPQKLTGATVAVVVASGAITDGIEAPGTIGGISTSALIRKAREDEQVKALVLRVDSPGGSAFGSELIRRELELTKKAGKPVVISMSNLAASGGYWISMAADKVIADPATITGSIGVIAVLPKFDKTADKLSLHTAGTTTTWLADPFNPLRPIDPRLVDLIQQGINHTYQDFTNKAASARKTSADKIHEVAQGRVWTGAQALERGLVDQLGSYQDALKSAAELAKVASNYHVRYIEREPSKIDKLFSLLNAEVQLSVAKAFQSQLTHYGIPAQAIDNPMLKELSWLAQLTKNQQAFTTLSYCFVVAP